MSSPLPRDRNPAPGTAEMRRNCRARAAKLPECNSPWAQNEVIANAVKPLVDWTPAQRETAIRRVYLSPANKSECASLDSDISAKVEAAGTPTKEGKAKVEVSLYQARKRFRDLKC